MAAADFLAAHLQREAEEKDAAQNDALAIAEEAQKKEERQKPETEEKPGLAGDSATATPAMGSEEGRALSNSAEVKEEAAEKPSPAGLKDAKDMDRSHRCHMVAKDIKGTSSPSQKGTKRVKKNQRPLPAEAKETEEKARQNSKKRELPGSR
eukprot:s3790_g5.t1